MWFLPHLDAPVFKPLSSPPRPCLPSWIFAFRAWKMLLLTTIGLVLYHIPPQSLLSFNDCSATSSVLCCSLYVFSHTLELLCSFAPPLHISPTSCSLTVTLTAHSLRGSSPSHTNSNHVIPQFLLTSLIIFCNTPVLPDILWTTPQDLQLSSHIPKIAAQTLSSLPQLPADLGTTCAMTPLVVHALTAWLVPGSWQAKLITYLWS